MGEFYILNGIFQEKIVFAFVAAIGIALAAYYALRMYQHAMHNRKPVGIESREVGLANGAVIAGLVACIVALALYPSLILHRANNSSFNSVAAAACKTTTYQTAAVGNTGYAPLITDCPFPDTRTPGEVQVIR